MSGLNHGDRRLLARCLVGEREASEAFVKQYSDLVFATVARTFGVKGVSFVSEDVEDLHSAVFLRLFESDARKLRQFKGKNGCSLASWIRMITVHTVCDYLRKSGVDGHAASGIKVGLEMIHELTGDEESPQIQLEHSERLRFVQKAMATLPARERLFLKLHIEKDLPISVVASTMGISMNNAYVLKHRTMAKLKGIVTKNQEKLEYDVRNTGSGSL